MINQQFRNTTEGCCKEQASIRLVLVIINMVVVIYNYNIYYILVLYFDNNYYIELQLIQILHVLDSMGLHQYKEAFSRESVDGAVLLELDEEVLRHELGINSKIHCIKLTKLISGDHSIQQFL